VTQLTPKDGAENASSATARSPPPSLGLDLQRKQIDRDLENVQKAVATRPAANFRAWVDDAIKVKKSFTDPAEPKKAGRVIAMSKTTAVLSLLHEGPGALAQLALPRLFRDQPVLRRDAQSPHPIRPKLIRSPPLLDDQQAAVQEMCWLNRAQVLVKSPRTAIAALDRFPAASAGPRLARPASRAPCCFDQGFHAPYIRCAWLSPLRTWFFLIDPSTRWSSATHQTRSSPCERPSPSRIFFYAGGAWIGGLFSRPGLIERLARLSCHPDVSLLTPYTLGWTRLPTTCAFPCLGARPYYHRSCLIPSTSAALSRRPQPI